MNSKQPETPNSETCNLRKMLIDISNQLSTTYIKKRALSKAHKQSPLEELQDAITYLSEKERELQVALDIAKYLLDSNEELQSKIAKLQETQLLLVEENKSLVIEVKNFKRALSEKNLKFESVSKTLTKTEGKLYRVSEDLKQELHNKIYSSTVEEEELIEQKYFYENQIRSLHKTIEDTQKQLENAKEEKEQMEKNLKNYRIQFDKINTKQKSTLIKLKESEKMQKILIESNDKLKKKIRQSETIKNKLSEKISRLEEEVKINENGQLTRTSENLKRSDSLLMEIQIAEMAGSEGRVSYDFSEEDVFSPRLFLTPDRCYSCSPRMSLAFLNTSRELSLSIPARQDKRDPIEEYFILTTQAVKMSSPHMDRIGILPHSFLYQKAKEEQIPFHRWHIWIENQFNFEYIQSLYKQTKPTSRFLNFFKKF